MRSRTDFGELNPAGRSVASGDLPDGQITDLLSSPFCKKISVFS